MTINCLLVDDEPASLNYITNCLADTPNTAIALSTNNSKKAFDFIQNNTVDLLLTDIDMPVVSGFELAKCTNINCKTIFITGYTNLALEALGKNAISILTKPFSQKQLINAVEQAYKIIFMENAEKENEQIQCLFKSLTSAEQKIILEIAMGKSTKQIADYLFVSNKTIGSHKENIKQKLNLKNSYALDIFAFKIAKLSN